MKTTKIITVLVILLIGTSFTTYGQEKDNIKTTVFDVNMHCGSCKVKLEKNISFEKGIKDMNVDLDKKEVSITYNTNKNSDEGLIAAFKKLGYTATVKTDKSDKKESDGKADEKTPD